MNPGKKTINTALCPHRIPGHNQYPDYPLIPCCIVRFNKVVDLLLKKPGQGLIFRCKVALAHDPACPLSFGIEDQQAPAAIIPADLRAGHVDRAVPFF